MGTHPIFESDFDCLTEMLRLARRVPPVRVKSTLARAGLLTRSTKLVAISAISGALGYAYGAFNLTPLDCPEMIVRSGRLAVTVVRVIYDFQGMKKLKSTSPSDYEAGMPDFHRRTAQRLYEMCCANRGTYIKVGQHIGAMEYLLPIEYINRFKTLHADAPKSTEAEVRSVVRAELGGEIEEIFSEWDWNPLGAASLAQCHRARIKATGEEVAVKVQHANVRYSAHLDLMLMEAGVLQCAKLFPEFKLGWLARTTRKNLPRELDFLHELQNAEKARLLYRHFSWLHIPKNYEKYSTSRILTMEYCPGIQVNDKAGLKAAGISIDHTMSRVTEMYSEMIFKFGFIHCDPHPGNVLIQKGKSGPRVILLDHGLYESTSDEFRYHYALLWKSIIKGDLPKIRLAARFLNVEDFFPLLSAMVSGRSWQSVKQGLENTEKISKTENELIQQEISMWIPEMSQVLENVPKQMILILKTNDLLRGLETTLDVRPDANAFITMSEHCLKALYQIDCTSEKATLRLWFEFQKSIWAIFVYKLYLRLTHKADLVKNLETASKEERMVEWHNSFARTENTK